jgi:hypothetical protein
LGKTAVFFVHGFRAFLLVKDAPCSVRRTDWAKAIFVTTAEIESTFLRNRARTCTPLLPMKRPRQPVDTTRLAATIFLPAEDESFDIAESIGSLFFLDGGFPRKTEHSIPIGKKIVPAGAEIVFILR